MIITAAEAYGAGFIFLKQSKTTASRLLIFTPNDQYTNNGQVRNREH